MGLANAKPEELLLGLGEPFDCDRIETALRFNPCVEGLAGKRGPVDEVFRRLENPQFVGDERSSLVGQDDRLGKGVSVHNAQSRRGRVGVCGSVA